MKRQLSLLPLTGRGGPGRGQGAHSTWKNTPTVPIRVPEKFAARLLQSARQLDQGKQSQSDVIGLVYCLLLSLKDSNEFPRNKGGAIMAVVNQVIAALKDHLDASVEI